MGDKVNFVPTLSPNATLQQTIAWLNNFAQKVQSASGRNLIQNVAASGATLSSIANAAANQIPIFTGPTSVGLLSAPAGLSTIFGFNNFRTPVSGPYTVQTSDAGATLSLGGNTFYTLTFPTTGSLNANHWNLVINTDTGRGKRITLTPGVTFILWPLQTCIVINDNGVWQVLPLSLPFSQRWVLPGNTTFFVDPVSGNDANDGLASGSGALASFNAVNGIINDAIDTNKFLLFFQLASGTYTNVEIFANVVGGGTVCLNGGNSASCTLQGTGGANALTCLVQSGGQGALFNSSFLFEHVTLTSSGGGHCFALSSGNAVMYQDVVYASAGAGNHIQVDSNNSRMFCQANYAITGGAASHVVAVGLGLLDFNGGGFTVTLSGTPNFTKAFAYATIMGTVVYFTLTFAGTGATGTRYEVDDTSMIFVNGGGANYFPGNAAGSSPTTQQYR